MADKVVNAVLTNRVMFFGAPCIISADKDARFIGSGFPPISQWCKYYFTYGYSWTSHKVRATERRTMYIKDIAQQIPDRRTRKKLKP